MCSWLCSLGLLEVTIPVLSGDVKDGPAIVSCCKVVRRERTRFLCCMAARTRLTSCLLSSVENRDSDSSRRLPEALVVFSCSRRVSGPRPLEFI